MMVLFDDDFIIEAYAKEREDNATYKEARKTAERLIKKGKMTLEDIADCVPSLSFDELVKLKAEIM